MKQLIKRTETVKLAGLKGKLEHAFLLGALVLGLGCMANAQAGAGISHSSLLQQKSSVEGTLTVSATVVSSVGILIGPNGEQTLIVANAPGAVDKISWSQQGTTEAAPNKNAGKTHATRKQP